MKVAIVTGANRGLGRETAEELARRGYTVVLAVRDVEAGAEVARGIEASGGAAAVVSFDATSEADAHAVAAFVTERFGRADALVNNAARIFDGDVDEREAVVRSIETNVLGALSLTRALAPLLEACRGTVVNVSSGMGALSDMGSGYTGYRVSKAALNAVTRILHNELSDVRVNAVCPGWVRTRMGGDGAPRDVASGASGIVWAATLPVDGPSGGFFRDGKPIDW